MKQMQDTQANYQRFAALNLGGKAAGHRLAEQITGDTRHLAQLGG